MSQPEDLPDTVGFVNRPIRNGVIDFKDRDVRLSREPRRKVLKGLTFHVAAGERVGIIGRIGSGKTTIGRLLGRLYLPTAGELLIDGIDVGNTIRPRYERQSASPARRVICSPVRSRRTLLMARPDATDEEIIAAARMAGVDEFVSNHPRGYDMNVGERGNNLSGGQKQAVAIARLLIAHDRKSSFSTSRRAPWTWPRRGT